MQPSELEREGNPDKLLGLLVPSYNMMEREQVGADRFVLNSKRASLKDLGQYYFLGVMMGACIRTGTIMMLDLPKSFWK